MKLVMRTLAKLRRDGLASTIITAAKVVRYSFDFKRREAYRRMLQQDSLQERFSSIYDQNLWSSPESGSGLGSELAFTGNIRAWLTRTIPALGIQKLVDAPCGDFNWMRLVKTEVQFDYLGFDIVENVVENNNRLYQDKFTKFKVANICEDAIPVCDMLIVRDCLFHLSYQDISSFLRNIARTNYKYLLTTSHITDESFRNKNITSGDFRLIDLFKAPFDFVESSVIDQVDDFPLGFSAPRRMVLIAKTDVPTVLGQN